MRSWNNIVLKIFGIHLVVEFENDEPRLEEGGVIVTLAQQSILDPTVGYAAWDKRVMSIWNIEYALIPFFGWVTILLGWIIVRQSPEQSKSQLRKAALHARNGGLVHLSAEGQRKILRTTSRRSHQLPGT